MQTLSNVEPIAPDAYTPEAEYEPEESYSHWVEDELADTLPYEAPNRSWQLLRLILLLMLLIAAAAFVVFVLLPSIDAWLNPTTPQLQPPVQV